MVLMDSVVHHDLFDHLFDGPAAALRWDRIGLESDRIGWAPALRHGYIWHGCRWWACRSIVLAPLGSIVMIINQSGCTLAFGLAHTTTKLGWELLFTPYYGILSNLSNY